MESVNKQEKIQENHFKKYDFMLLSNFKNIITIVVPRPPNHYHSSRILKAHEDITLKTTSNSKLDVILFIILFWKVSHLEKVTIPLE